MKAPHMPFFTKDYSSRSKKKPDYANGRSSSNNRSTAKEVVQKYLKPIYYKISQKHDHYGQSSFLEQQLGMDDEFEWPCIVDESSRLNQFSNFSGNLKMGYSRPFGVESCPPSMNSSPSHSGILTSFYNEDLQNAIQGAIAHCKQSNGIVDSKNSVDFQAPS